MMLHGLKENSFFSGIKKTLKSSLFQRIVIVILTVLAAFVIVENGAAPKKYRLTLGDKSPYDITAPRDVENKVKTEQNRKASASAVKPVMKEISAAPLEVLSSAVDFSTMVDNARKSVDKSIQNLGIGKKDKNYPKLLEKEQDAAASKLYEDVKKLSVPLSREQAKYLVSKAGDEEIASFNEIVKNLMTKAMGSDITESDLPSKIEEVQNEFQSKYLDQDLKNIGELLVKSIIKPNRTIDTEATESKRQKAFEDRNNIEKISRNSRILSVGDTVTEDKLSILRELDLLETGSKVDLVFASGIFAVILLLAAFLIIFMVFFSRQILNSRKEIILISVVIIFSLGVAMGINNYSSLAIPVFIAPMLISILVDTKVAVAVNFVLALAISLITGDNPGFLYISLISGSFSAFLVARANQRIKLTASGFVIALINVVIISCVGIINKSSFSAILNDSVIVFLNGAASIVITIGLLPLLESAFNIITPMKLLELANPNQALIKRLLMEAPGTYHHSLMVGNLAEVATEAIGGNALLARVGAYFHDVGKLKRPNFFRENQLTDNPHDRMTANLSTLVITSHTKDGAELAEKFKIPAAIKDIINQHHGTTLVAYFYHKAKKGEKGDQVKPENFRYEGPKPTTKESAVVMLADSVEAAVRSMIDKTEGKIEGLVRKIIKDKLDDGQLDLCDLTLKDLDNIAKGFMQVFSGFFHEREEYPEIRLKMKDYEIIKIVDPVEEVVRRKVAE